MKLGILLLMSAAGFTEVAAPLGKRQTTNVNMASALSEASVLTTHFSVGTTTLALPFVTPGGNLIQPLASLISQIITAVPASVLVELAIPAQRSSIASEFKAGSTSAGLALIPDRRNRLTQIVAGDVNLSATPSVFRFPVTTAMGSATATDKAAGQKVATSTSKAKGARATGVGMGFVATIGFLRVALAL
ncbi:hypothetical protein BDZ45DRAFT_736296 [Acephala macrosclerotiorum]|nr:hypothetical protein BDZ45DRAFT_736296 [Acephala macrosclerotiorum]